MGINLIAFPFAGGSSFSYTSWLPYLDRDVHLHTFEPRGHGRNMKQEWYHSFEEEVEDAFGFVKACGTGGEPYVLFGHSMGAYILYEVYKKILGEGLRMPLGMIYSGNVAPHMNGYDKTRKDVRTLNDTEFAAYVKADGGVSDEILDVPEIREVYMPIIRNDYILIQGYEFDGTIRPFSDNIAVFYGKEDRIPLEFLTPWQKYTTKKAEISGFNGGHMFISSEAKDVVQTCMNYINTLRTTETR